MGRCLQAADFEKAFHTSLTKVVEVGGRFAGYLQIDVGAARPKTICAC
jgi:hypothetical protein